MEKGSTLLEILIAMSIFSIAILSIIYLQGSSARNIQAAINLTNITEKTDAFIFKIR